MNTTTVPFVIARLGNVVAGQYIELHLHVKELQSLPALHAVPVRRSPINPDFAVLILRTGHYTVEPTYAGFAITPVDHFAETFGTPQPE